MDGITGVIPCAIHIDHHETENNRIPVDTRIIVKDAGFTSTIITLLLNELQSDLSFDISMKIKSATALYLGIQTDTDYFTHATSLDSKANDLIKSHADKILIRRISGTTFSAEIMHLMNQAVHNQVVMNDWLISGLGFIKENHRDAIAIIGDFLLKRKDISKVMIFSIVEKKNGLTLDASFRTKEKKFNLNKIIKKISSEGGSRHYKGAFQVNLDFFRYCPDKDILWKIVYITTLEALKEHAHAFGYSKFKKLYQNFKKKLFKQID